MCTEPEKESRPKRVPCKPEATALERAEEVGRAAGGELVDAALTATTGVPGLGDALSTYLGGLFPSIKERRADAWLGHLRSAVNWLLRHALTIDDIRDNDQFHDIVCEATEAARRTHLEEKRQALRNAIVNAPLPGAPSQVKQHMFVRLVDELDVHHLLLLGLMAEPAEFLKARGLPLPGPANDHYTERDALTQHKSPRSLLSIVNNVLRDVLPEDLDDLAMQDLMRRGLVVPKTTFSTLCVGSSLASPLGREFISFISAPVPPKAKG